LTDSLSDLIDLVNQAEGKVDRVQIDIVDGKFANNRTIDPSALNEVDTTLKLDYHLMVVEPSHWIEKCVRAQADRVIGHIEKMGNQAEFVKKVQKAGARVGVAIDIETSVDMIESQVLSDIDVVLVMSVKAGFGGQEFDKRALSKIDKLNKFRTQNNWHYKICDDGGITLECADDLEEEGVDEISIGRRIFKGDMIRNIEQFRSKLDK